MSPVLSGRLDSIRVGLVGAGWFGGIHLDTWNAIDGVDVVAVCDIDTSLRAGLKDQRPQNSFHRDLGIGNRKAPSWNFYSDIAQLLDREQLDVLDIVAPEAEHYSLAKTGLLAGLPVIVEKPFVLSAEEAISLCQISTDTGHHVYVGNILRFDSRQIALKDVIAASGDGVRHMSFQRHFQVAAQSVYGRIHPFFGACIHDVDLAIWFMGAYPSRVFAVGRSWNQKKHPDVVVGILEWPDGAYAVLQNTWHLAPSCPYGFEFETKIFLKDSTCIVRNHPDLEIWSADGVKAPELFFWPVAAGVRTGALRRELAHFADCLRLSVPSDRVPYFDACAGVAVAEALIRSSKSGGWEPVPGVPRDFVRSGSHL